MGRVPGGPLRCLRGPPGQVQGLLQPAHEAVDPCGGLRVGGLDTAIEGGVANDLDLVPQVVEDEERVGDEEQRLRESEGILGR